MSEFKAITTQEEFDSAIQKRLAQKEREVAERFKGYLTPDDVEKLKSGYDEQIKTLKDDLEVAKEKISGFDAELSEAKAKATKAEHALLRGKVAAAKGLPLELADRLVGESKEELEKDAESFASFMRPRNTPPMRSNDPANGGDPTTAAKSAFNEWFSQFNQN